MNDYLLTKQEAEDMADEWRSEGYDDVEIEEYKLQEELSSDT